MSDTLVLPPRLTLLGQTLHPLWVTLKTRLDGPVGGSSAAPDMAKFLTHHLQVMRNACSRLEDRMRGLMADVVSNEAASHGDVQRSAARFEAVVDDLLDGHREVRALNVHGENAEARDLLAGAYRHLLVEIRDWLGELVEALADPLAAARRRGVAVDGPVELALTLKLTSAPQLAALARWADRQSLSSAAASSGSPGSARPGFWDTVCVIALGWGIGNALFGNDDRR